MPDSVSRRDFVALAGAAAAAEMAPRAAEAAPAAPAPLKPLANEPEAYTYLTAPEAAFVEAAVERLIPADELGPGAREAGVAFFIEQQLNGQFGYASKTYMHGPWAAGTPMQGYQLPLTPREIYRLAIGETNAYCVKKYGKTFDKLAPATQDQVLQALDAGTVTFEAVPAKLFFEMLFTNTQQGFFADPLYGGNRNKIGWKLIGHPGVPVAYNAFIGKHDVPYHVAEPVGIADVERELGVGGQQLMATLKPVDAVMVGFGWTGGILAHELAKAGLSVVGLERGEFRDTHPDFAAYSRYDELAYAVQYKMMQDTSKETLTFRNERSQTALPMRQLGSFLPGDGVGGAGVHWNGATWRFLPADFAIRSHNAARYGAGIFGDDCTSADWGVTYDELEPYYDRFEYLCGIAGRAGNINGKVQPGGNPFEGTRTRDYPNPPMIRTSVGETFARAAQSLGYHPFPQPSANSTRRYTNPEGVTLGECIYCGHCERFGCETGAKASLQTTLWPKLAANSNFELRTHAKVLHVNLDSTGKKAVSVTYLDSHGREQVQPANMIFLTAFGLNNVRLLLLSKIGTPYDPVTGTGVVGRNYAYQSGTNTQLFFNSGKYFNAFMGAGSLGVVVDDFNSDNFDHAGLGFIAGGSVLASSLGNRPIQFHPVPKGTPRWGSAWKKAVSHYYNRAMGVGFQGSVQSYRGNYLDLDPTYRDIYGQPLLRMTFDYGAHEHKASAFIIPIQEKIARAAGASSFTSNQLAAHYSVVPYQSTHNTGGAIMGTDPAKSVVNKYLQSWDVPNVFVTGSSAFPQNAGYNPTGTIGALTYHAADAILGRYVKSPGPLA